MNSASTSQRESTLVDALERRADTDPDARLLDFDGTHYSCADVVQAAHSLATGLIADGTAPGDRIATMIPNSYEAVVSVVAAGFSGAIAVPLNTALKGQMLSHQLLDSGATVLVISERYLNRLATLDAAVIGTLRLVVVRSDESDHPEIDQRSSVLYDELASATPDPSKLRRPRPADVSFLFYTGGTTGPSKACMIRENYLYNIARQSSSDMNRQATETVWTPLPLFHLNPWSHGIISSLLVGGSVAIADRFSVSKFWPQVERSNARIVTILGAMITLVGRAPDTEASIRCRGQLRVVRGAPFPDDMRKVWKSRFGVSRAGSFSYGSTEAGLITTMPAGVPEPDRTSCGQRNSDFDVRIVDDDDNELPAGTSGEIVCRPLKPNIMFSGYWNRPEDTLAAMRNLWWHTGDIGRFDNAGWLHFVGRKKDYLRRRGENVSAAEVEAIVERHHAVLEAVVYGVPADLGEDDIKLDVMLQPNVAVTAADLGAWCAGELPGYAVPRYIEVVEDIPRSSVGRIEKYALRARGVTDAAWDGGAHGVGARDSV